MLTVEQRHAILTGYEASLRTARSFGQLHGEPGEHRLDAAVRTHIADEAARHDFYELINSITDWGMHPAVREATA